MRATASSLGMQTDIVPSGTNVVALGQSRCREPRVLHAWFFDFPPQISPEFSPSHGYSTNGD